jgi:hypothetical protein
MTLAKDNYIDPDTKARWGFGGSEGKITVGPQTVGETGGVDHARTIPDDSGAHNNGGGSDGITAGADGSAVSTTTDIDSMTVAQLKEQLDAKGIAYKSTDAKADLVAALKAADEPAADAGTETQEAQPASDGSTQQAAD